MILGVWNGHNSSVAIGVDGELKYAALEERFCRKKFVRAFPHAALNAGLETLSISPKDITVVACGAFASPSKDAVSEFLSASKDLDQQMVAARLYHSLLSDKDYRVELIAEVSKRFPGAKLKFYDHHESHAASAFYFSNFEDASLLTADGRGDLQSLVVWTADRVGGLRRVFTNSELGSLGALYGQVTGALGFTPDRHEGKVTGLAAYGEQTELVDRFLELLHFDGEKIRIGPRFTPFLRPTGNEFKQLIQGYTREDVAYAVQTVLERTVLGVLQRFVPKESNLCLAGGIFANVKLNQRVREAGYRNIFVFPEMGDGGNSVGGLALAAAEAGEICAPLNSVRLGPEFIWREENSDGMSSTYFEDQDELISCVVDLIIAGKIVGLFCDRMEFGPRALGSRSILLSATDPSVNDSVNRRLNRTEFMPFAPVTLEREAEKMFMGLSAGGDTNTRFMTTCYPCTQLMKDLSPAAVHIDGTARPQIINENNSPRLYYKILQAYWKKTGIPSLLNTSFNNHEEPIVCSPTDAVDSLRRDNIDLIATEKYLIRRFL